MTVVDCEVLQNLLSQVKIRSHIIFIICVELFDDGDIEKVAAALVYCHSPPPHFKVEALRFRQRSEDVAPLALWMVLPKLMATKRLILHIAYV